jgi:hypothetical protein
MSKKTTNRQVKTIKSGNVTIRKTVTVTKTIKSRKK